jgi:Repeat of unknown function (DUF5648)/Cadherin domain
MTATPGQLPVDDDDGDFFSDPNVAEERAEVISVNNQPADLTGYINAHSIQVNDLKTVTLLQDVASIVASAATLFLAGPAGLWATVALWSGLVGEALQVYSSLTEQFTLQDPYDPNYHTLYVPKVITLPSFPNDPNIPSQLKSDALSYGLAVTSAASDADALYVTQNRMLSAIHDGDLAGFQLQNAQLNKLVFLLGNAHTMISQAATALADDFASAGFNLSVTPQQFTDFIDVLSAGGFSALPQAEQDIINQFSTDPGLRDALIQFMTSAQLNAPTDLVSLLKAEASVNASLGAAYSLPNDPNAIADVHQAIITSSAINDTLTEHGSPLSEAGTIGFLDANSTLSPTASVTATTVTATGTGLVLTDAQKAAFANDFSIDAHTGSWSFNLKGSDAAFLIPGDSVKIVATVTIDDGQGGTATQDETFTILGSNEAPIITSNGGGDTAAVSIAENTTAVTTLTATDPDRGQTLGYSISGGADASKFAIDTSTGALSFVTAPNFEAPTDVGGDNVYDVTVKASDGQGGIATQAIAVSVQNVTEISRAERFFDSATGDHFYTLSPDEANQIRATLPTYHDEGAPWGTPDKGSNTIDVFRFFDVATGAHFLTTSTAERDQVLATLPSYHFEGVGFEAYSAPGDGTLTLERFFNTQTHLHHYAASAAEIASIQSGGAGPAWVDEGAGFIVHT